MPLELHPSLAGKVDPDDPHQHKVEGFSQEELKNLGEKHGLRPIKSLIFGIPIPDRLFAYLPRVISRVAVNGLEDDFPGGLRHFIAYRKEK